MTESTISKVKEYINNSVGEKVKFKIKKGKNRSILSEGTIVAAYPAIFTVCVETKGLKRVLAFNYIDLLTEYVQMFLCNNEETRII